MIFCRFIRKLVSCWYESYERLLFLVFILQFVGLQCCCWMGGSCFEYFVVVSIRLNIKIPSLVLGVGSTIFLLVVYQLKL